MIEIKKLYLKYIREYYALYDINLTVEDGQSLALIGEDGSGKTSLLRVLAKLEKFDKGEIYLKDINIKKVNFKDDVSLGYIGEVPVFFENKTVYDNFRYVLKSRGFKDLEIEEKLNAMIIEYNLEMFRDVKAKDLSLYEKYIIALLRLSLRPLDIVLVDDIFTKVDDSQKQIIVQMIKHLFIEKKVTTLVASNNETLLKGVCKKFIKFKNGSID